MLDLMGIPYLKSCGEAEALCALLNSVGMVHGVLTDDTDTLLYGASTVYRSVVTSGSKVSVYLLLLHCNTVQLRVAFCAILGI